jgi:hypothetical protein
MEISEYFHHQSDLAATQPASIFSTTAETGEQQYRRAN